LAVSPDGSCVYVTGGGSVSVISTSSNTVTATIPVGSADGVAVTPNGQYAYVTNYGAGTVSVISTVAPSVTIYSLNVTVIDAVTGSPVVGATVYVYGPQTLSGVTGASGTADFTNVQAGTYLVNATAAGYGSSSTQTVLLTSDPSITISLEAIPANYVPEVPIGTIAATATLLLALLGYLYMPKWKLKRTRATAQS